MTTPEPLDEFGPDPAETRGGDQLADITVLPKDAFVLPVPEPGTVISECSCGMPGCELE